MGLPRRHPRRPRGRGVRCLRGHRLGHRPADLAARRAAGPGMVQLLARARPGRRRPVTLVACGASAAPAGWHVLDGVDEHDRAGDPRPRGHRAAAPDGGLRHRRQQHRPQGRPRAARWPTGIGTASTTASCFHPEHKLRTVLWGWAGEPLTADEVAGVRAGSRRRSSGLSATRSPGTWPTCEVDAIERRCRRLLDAGVLPDAARRAGRPSRGRRSDATARLGFARMRAWTCSRDPRPCPLTGPPVAVHDTSTGRTVVTRPTARPGMYVCGITPYDATHLGHAATYVAFDLLNRAWRYAGHEVTLRPERHRRRRPAAGAGRPKVHVDWVELAERETELFRQDMQALRVLPPDALRRRRRVDPAGRRR